MSSDEGQLLHRLTSKAAFTYYFHLLTTDGFVIKLLLIKNMSDKKLQMALALSDLGCGKKKVGAVMERPTTATGSRAFPKPMSRVEQK